MVLTKMDFTGVVAPRMPHDFKFEPNRSTLRYPADPPKKGSKSRFLTENFVPFPSCPVSKKNLIWPSGSKNSPKIIFKSFPVLPRPQNGR